MQTVNNLTLYYTTCKNYCQFLIAIFDRKVIPEYISDDMGIYQPK